MATTGVPAVGTAMPTAAMASEDLLARVRGEYDEMPGLRLTSTQAARLWNLDQTLAAGLLSALVESGILVRSPSGQYRRSKTDD